MQILTIAYPDLTVERIDGGFDPHLDTTSTIWRVAGPGLVEELRYVQWSTRNMSGSDWTVLGGRGETPDLSRLIETQVRITGLPETVAEYAVEAGADDPADDGSMPLDSVIEQIIEEIEDAAARARPEGARAQAVENLRLAHDRGVIDLADVLVQMLTPAGAIGEWDSETIELVLHPAKDALEAAGLAWIGGPGNDNHRYWACVALDSGTQQDFFDEAGRPNWE